MNIDFSQFLNPYDIAFVIICIISIFFGLKNGLIKSLFNLFKWIAIFYLIKNCFNYLRPVVDPYIINETISDVLIFLFTLITSYLLISFLNRLIIGVLQPKKSGVVDLAFGSVLGLFRGYIVFVLIIFFIETNITLTFIPDFLNEGTFKDMIDHGVNFLNHIPRNLDKINNLDI